MRELWGAVTFLATVVRHPLRVRAEVVELGTKYVRACNALTQTTEIEGRSAAHYQTIERDRERLLSIIEHQKAHIEILTANRGAGLSLWHRRTFGSGSRASSPASTCKRKSESRTVRSEI